MMSTSLADELNFMDTYKCLLCERNAFVNLDGKAMHQSSPLKYWSYDFLPVLGSVLVEEPGEPVLLDILLHPGNAIAYVGNQVNLNRGVITKIASQRNQELLQLPVCLFLLVVIQMLGDLVESL